MRILIIGDLKGQLVSASRIAIKNGAKVLHVNDVASAIHTLCSGKSAEMILIASDMDIVLLISKLQAERIVIPVVACGVADSPEIAAKAIEDGAVEYLSLPPNEELIAAVLENIAKRDLQNVMIFKSSAFFSVVKTADKIASSNANILITGASGTGKEIMARYIHQHSKRNTLEMITVNCAAIPDNLLESEMFGHEKGAFTGASEKRIGKFEESNHSTILLDEISEMDLRLQAKLLRVIQEREITRIGSNKPIKLDIRIIATSNRDLVSEIHNGRFREDLFFRLNVINLELPKLNQRSEDIDELTQYFISKYANINGITVKNITQKALTALKQHNWPGNIRELENTIHRALLISDIEIQEDDIMLLNNSRDQLETLASAEKRAILKAIDVYGHDKDRAAVALGISIKILREKLAQYRLGD